MNPKLSFIVSAWNRPRHLQLCLQSLLLQTMDNWEAIVVDKCGYNRHIVGLDDRIEYVQKDLKNEYYACEFGAELAISDYLCFPSDDSYYVPQFAERMLKCTYETNADLVYCDFIHGHHDEHNYLCSYPSIGSIDKTTFIVRREKTIPFAYKDSDYALADGHFIEDMVANEAIIVKVPQVLVVHN